MTEDKKSKRNVLIIVIGLILVVAVTTISYALWTNNFTQTGVNNTKVAECFNIKYTEGEDVSLIEEVPVTDEDGMQNTTPYAVTVENKCDSVVAYNVVLNKNKNSTLADTHVKVTTGAVAKLLSETETAPTNTNDGQVPSGYTDGNSNIVSKSYVGPNETKTVKVKTWMDENTPEEEGQNKTFNYKISIEATATNKMPKLESVKILGKTYPVINGIPDFSKGFPNSETSKEETEWLSGLYQSYDDDGDTYYFRGAVTNNYVSFAGKTWRILRINGDGTIRLILNDKIDGLSSVAFNAPPLGDYHQYVGYTYNNLSSCTNANPCKSTYNTANKEFAMSSDATNSTIKEKLEEWYINNLNDYDSKIAITTFCNDTSYGSGEEDSSNFLYYGSRDRTRAGTPSLECPSPKRKDGSMRNYGGVYKLKIGLINADELNIGGYSWGSSHVSTENFLKRSSLYWTLSPEYAYTSHAFVILAHNDGNFSSYGISNAIAVFPVINLKSGVQITGGDGTESNPYLVD